MLKLQTLSNSQTKRLSFKPTFKGHGIITYLNHASTKDVHCNFQGVIITPLVGLI